MTDPVNPPIVINLPPAPLIGDSPEQFDEKAFPFAEALDPWGQSLNALGVATKTNAVSAHESSLASENSAAESAKSAEAAGAYANMRGGWSELTGAMAPPATVYHAGEFWALLRPITNVSASEPGVSGDWAQAFTVTDQILATMNAVALSM